MSKNLAIPEQYSLLEKWVERYNELRSEWSLLIGHVLVNPFEDDDFGNFSAYNTKLMQKHLLLNINNLVARLPLAEVKCDRWDEHPIILVIQEEK